MPWCAMVRRMSKAVLINPDVHARLKSHCEAHGLKIKFITEAAILEYIPASGAESNVPTIVKDEVPA